MTPRTLDLVRNFAWHVSMEGPVLEIGAYVEANQEHLDLRQAFPRGTPYVGADVIRGPGVDLTVDLLDEGQVSATASGIRPKTILCLYVFEHVFDIFTAARTIGRLRREHPEAWLWVSSHQNQPFHGTDKYGDYWRFTAPGMRRLMEDVAGVEGVHVLVHPDTSNPEDVLAIRQPASVAWSEEQVAKAIRASVLGHWEIYC